MAKEVLELEVKSNIKQVTKDQEKYNKELAETTSCLPDILKSLVLCIVKKLIGIAFYIYCDQIKA